MRAAMHRLVVWIQAMPGGVGLVLARMLFSQALGAAEVVVPAVLLFCFACVSRDVVLF